MRLITSRSLVQIQPPLPSKKILMVEISIIVPAYNERENIPDLLAETYRMMGDSKLKCELILVDDGSTDETYKEACRLKKKYRFLKILRHKRNFGKTEAILTGLDASKGKLIILLDADLQYSPSCIPTLVAHLKTGFDMVTGWKTGKYEKRFTSSVYNFLSRKLFSIPIHDQNSIKVLKREVLEDIPLRKDWHRYIVALAYDRGYKISEVKVKLHPRKYGTPKYSRAGRIIVGVLDLLSVKFQISFSKKPLLLFGTMGGSLLLIGFILGVVAIILRVFYHHGFRPVLYLIILLILAGLSLFAIGFIVEAIAALGERLTHFERRVKNI